MASGRKREFDEETAINAAMNVFWQKGYVGASLTDLTKSMGINKPSMYSAFGNKEALFIKATQHYVETKMKSLTDILLNTDQPLFDRLKNYMMAIVENQCESAQPKGCYLVLCQSELAGGDIPEEAATLLKAIENIPKETFSTLFKEDKEARALELDKQADSIALSLYTLLKGTASMARSGFKLADLENAVDNMLKGIRV